jgi:hypothetical protein
MENTENTRVIRFALMLAKTNFGQWMFSKSIRRYAFLFAFLAFCHSIYWLTAWWSPWPFIAFNLFGLWFGGGPFKPWGILISQGMKQPNYDLNILKICIPFMAINWTAIFACLYMFGAVLENGSSIAGTWKHFYFSVVTLTTLGYGNIVPSGFLSELLVTIESLIGFLGFAILTGIITSITIKRFE